MIAAARHFASALAILLPFALFAPGASPLMAQGVQRQPAPRNAMVYFHYPLDGLRVPERFTVRIGLKEMGLLRPESTGPAPAITTC